jgi:cytochrome c oxidase subunit IV
MVNKMGHTTGTVTPGVAAAQPSVGHSVPLWLLGAVLLGLLLLTWLTVGVTYVDLGRLNLWIAMGIATLKGFLVALYFMHLRWDRPFHGVVFLSALVFVMIFVGFVLVDTDYYQPDMIPGYSPAMDQAAQAAATGAGTAEAGHEPTAH